MSNASSHSHARQFSRLIDHTLLKPEATPGEIDQIVAQALEHEFASVCVQPLYTKRIAEKLKGTPVLACCVIGFPQGTNKSTIKAIEATSAVKDGAQEIDVVAHLPYLIAMDVQAAKNELLEITRAARAANSSVVIKVIVESAAILANQANPEAVIEAACKAVRESGCDFIKTSTGYHPAGGASEQVVKWMKQHAGGIKVKASGGIRDLAAAQTMLNAGADRLGLSAGVAIINQLKGQSAPTASTGGY
jgi:deoxyribose-phosphate aldolase